MVRWVRIGLVAAVIGGCARPGVQPPREAPTAPPDTLAQVVRLLERTATAKELEARIGVPDGEVLYNPGDPTDPYPPNWRRYTWANTLRAHPPRLFSTLPSGSPTLLYELVYPDEQQAGTLAVFLDQAGRIKGWAYNRHLATQEGAETVRLRP